MRVLFLCSGLEPGRDGVGDYTVVLAKHCTDHGADVAIAALRDPCIHAVERSLREGIPTLRLPHNAPWHANVAPAETFIEQFSPDVTSIQWVPFGLDKRGLPLAWGKRIRSLIGQTMPVHIMFHETWVGLSLGAPRREKLLGWMQRFVMAHLLRQFKPRAVHTHARPYQAALQELSVNANILPLSSNVRWISARPGTAAEASPPSRGPTAADERRFIVFGNTPLEWSCDALFSAIGSYARQCGVRSRVIFAGRGGPEGTRRQGITEAGQSHGLDCAFLGFNDENHMAQLLMEVDFGVATVPFALWQKSSAVAAYRAFGLPVIFTRFDVEFPASWMPERLSNFMFLGESLDKQLANPVKAPLIDLWPDTTRQFLGALESAVH